MLLLPLLALGQCSLLDSIADLLKLDPTFELEDATPALLQTLQAELDLGPVPADASAMWAEVLDTVPNAAQKLRAEMARANSSPESLRSPKPSVLEAPEDAPQDADEFIHVSSPKFPKHSLRIKEPKLGIDDVVQYSGYLDLHDEDKHLFFYFFESRTSPETDPTVMWLNGGPGCSSMLGLFFELGPVRINSSAQVEQNPWSWNQNANIFFLDQPVGTGFSYGNNHSYSTIEAAHDNYAFLELFFQQFPQYGGRDFHIAGESYAGHYVPVFADHHLKQQDRSFNVTSVLIGNGLVDPLRQYDYFAPMACGEGGYPAVLSNETCTKMRSSEAQCDKLIRRCYETHNQWHCAPATVYCNAHLLNPYAKSGLNMYDVRMKCEDDDLCYKEMPWIDQYLTDPAVKKQLGVQKDFEDCDGSVYYGFTTGGDWMIPYYHTVSHLLDAEIPVLVYAGDKDFICNWLGNEHWSLELPWKYHDKFAALDRSPWLLSDGTEVGQARNYEHYTFLRVYDAGHMVPYDQPEASQEMFNRWISGDYAFDS